MLLISRNCEPSVSNQVPDAEVIDNEVTTLRIRATDIDNDRSTALKIVNSFKF